MKHPHRKLIKQYFYDTDTEFELSSPSCGYRPVGLDFVIRDNAGVCAIRVKQKPDEYQVFRDALKDGKKIEWRNSVGEWRAVVSYPSFTKSPDHYRICVEYRELREAKADGKRVIFQSNSGEWVDASGLFNEEFPPSRYKIVEHDQIIPMAHSVFGETIEIVFIKSGITGEISVEIVK